MATAGRVRALAAAGALVTTVLAGLVPEPDRPPQDPGAAPRSATGDASCRACHPGPTAGLRRSDHAFLLTDRPESSCTVCHGEAGEHAASAARPGQGAPAPAGAVAAASCAACHQDEDHEPAAGAHPWQDPHAEPRDPGAPPEILPAEAPTRTPDPGIAPVDALGMEWSGLARLGHRFLDRGGSRDRYETDVDLGRGPRLSRLELAGRGDDGWLDRVDFRARDLADPHSSLELDLARTGRYEGSAGWSRRSITYAGGGDFHRVDRRSEETGYRVSWEYDEDHGLFAGYRRLDREGFWLTHRIGNRNVTPQTTVTGVASPRHLRSETVEVGGRGNVDGTSYGLTLEYLDERSNDRWTWSRPAVANPSFTASEDFRSRNSLRGPGVRWTVGRDFGPLRVDLDGLARDLTRRLSARGTTTGFDISDFTRETRSSGGGSARSARVDLTAAWTLHDRLLLLGDLRYLDHEERLVFDHSEVTTYPTLGSATATSTRRLQETRQRKWSGSLSTQVEPHEGLILEAGWGFAREYLRVPDLVAGDDDFVEGNLQNDGLLLGVQWRPDEHWTLRGRWEDFGQNGIQLHELTEDDGRRLEGDVRWRGEGVTAGVFARNRRSLNDVSFHRSEVLSLGGNASLQPDDGLDLGTSYVYSEIDSRTLTNFYFDPDPDPVPTVVGFAGRTHTVSAWLTAEPSAGVRWNGSLAWTGTNGSFAVDLLDWRSEVTVDICPGGRLGTELRVLDYQEDGPGDHDARIVFVFLEALIGR